MSEPPRAEEPQEHGWYRDVADARRHRYWNGRAWFTQDQVFPAADLAADLGAGRRRTRRSWDWPLWDPAR